MSKKKCSQSDVLSAQSVLRSAAASQEQFNALLPVVIAQYAALQAPLPTQPVSDIYDYILDNKIDIDIYQTVSAVSSYCVISYNEVRHLALQFYKFRYAMCHGGVEALALTLAAFTNTSGDLVPTDVKEILAKSRGDHKISDAISRAIYCLAK